MKTSKKIALALGLAAGATLAYFVGSKQNKKQITKKVQVLRKSDTQKSNLAKYDDSEVNYI